MQVLKRRTDWYLLQDDRGHRGWAKRREMAATLLGMERQIQSECAKCNDEATLGTQNLLQGIADRSEMRVYKLRQFIK